MLGFKKVMLCLTLCAMPILSMTKLEAVAYVTDTGGYAYDEGRTATYLAPAIALGTVAIVGIVAIAVQNSHHHSSSSHSHAGSSSYGYDYSSSYFSHY